MPRWSSAKGRTFGRLEYGGEVTGIKAAKKPTQNTLYIKRKSEKTPAETEGENGMVSKICCDHKQSPEA